MVETLLDQSSIAQFEECACHFKYGFSAGLLVQQEAWTQVKTVNYDAGRKSGRCYGEKFLPLL